MMRLLEDAGEFLTKSCDYACRQFHLQVVTVIEDFVEGKKYRKAFILKDKQGRRYYFVAKRRLHFIENRAEVSISRDIMTGAFSRNCTLMLLIENKTEEGPSNYVYTTDPNKVYDDDATWENFFNEQWMVNFNAKWLVNMEQTRMRGPVEIRIEQQAEKEKNSITRWIK